MTAEYTAFNIANSSDPSISEVYFYISSTKVHLFVYVPCLLIYKSVWKSLVGT